MLSPLASLDFAFTPGERQAALLLVRHGAKLDATDREGNTAMSLCATKEQRTALLAAASVDGPMDTV